jgi:hypothetical protein
MDFQPKFSTEGTFTPDDLVAGGPLKTDAGVLAAGQNVVRGALLGKVTAGAVTVNALSGKGALTPDATTPLLAGAQAGAYKAVCIAADTDSGTFRVFDPSGNVLGDVVVGATFANQIKFAIADGGTDFAAGDTFTVTVAAGNGQYKLSLAAAVDGSQKPVAVASADANGTDGVVPVNLYIEGDFNSRSMVFGTGHTAASVKDVLGARGIHLKTPVAR